MSAPKTPTAIPAMTVHMDDGREMDCKPSIGDMARYDVIRPRKQWPRRDEAEVLFMSALCWIALRRTGQIESGETVEQFIDHVEAIDVDAEDDADPNDAAAADSDDAFDI